MNRNAIKFSLLTVSLFLVYCSFRVQITVLGVSLNYLIQPFSVDIFEQSGEAKDQQRLDQPWFQEGLSDCLRRVSRATKESL